MGEVDGRQERFCSGKFRAVQYFFFTIARVGVPHHALPFMRLCSDHRDNSIVQTPHAEPGPSGSVCRQMFWCGVRESSAGEVEHAYRKTQLRTT